jgi:GPH family glycoside/pentoside/hexuronide:cation symporter
MIFFFVTFASTRERIAPAPDQRTSVRQDFADLTRNPPWIVMFVLTIVLFVTLALRGGTVLYYWKYYAGRENLFSLFNVLGTGATIVGVIFSKPLAVRYGKRNLFIGGLAFTVLFTAGFAVLPPSAVAVMMVMEMLRQFAYGFTIPLLWAMMADVADFSEWKNRRRATGVVFSAIVFGLKAGLGVGGALGGYILAGYGYVPNVAQSPHALDGIRLMMSLFPAIGFGLCLLCLFFYRIDLGFENRLADELARRRLAYAPSQGTT